MPIPLSTPQRLITGVDGFPNKGTLPAFRTLTGTYSSSGVVVTGTSSLFTTEVVEGDWLFNATTNELRKVQGVTIDTILILEAAFSSDASGEDVAACRTLYRSISITISGTVAATFNESTFQPGEVYSLNSNNSIAAVTYDASGGSEQITFDVVY